MKSLSRMWLAVAVLVGVSGVAQATTFTVTADSILTRANAQAVAGDVVNLAAGTYTVGIAPANSGTSGSQITYLGASLANRTLTTVLDDIDLDDKSFISVKGITTTGNCNLSFVTGRPMVDSVTYCTIKGSVGMNGALYCCVTHDSIGNGSSTTGDRWVMNIAGTTVPNGNTISDNVMELYATDTNGGACIVLHADSCTVERNKVSVVLSPYTNAHGWMMYGSANNFFTDNRWTYYNNSTQSDIYGMYLRDISHHNSFVRDTFVAEVTSPKNVAIKFDGGGNDSLCDYNTWTDCYVKCSGQIGSERVIVGANLTGNTFISQDRWHLWADSLTMRHNTLIVTQDAYGGVMDNCSVTAQIVRYSTLRSNIFYSTTGVATYGMLQLPIVYGVDSDSNLVYSPVTGNQTKAFRLGDGGSTCALGAGAAWCDTYSNDCNSQWFDPVFTDSLWTAADATPNMVLAYSDSLWPDGYVGAVDSTTAPTEYTLTLTSTNGGTVVADPAGGTYDTGTAVLLTATANTGWHFTAWSGSVTGATDTITVIMDGNRSVLATFDWYPYTLTVTVSAADPPAYDGYVTATPDSAVYYYGRAVKLAAFDSTGFVFSSWSGDTTVTGGTLHDTLTVIIQGNTAITANFAEAYYTLSTSAVNGTISRDLNPYNGLYDYGVVVELTAGASTGYHFVTWTGDTTTTTNPLSVPMWKDRVLSATFALDGSVDSVKLTVTAVHGTVAADPVSPSGNYAPGDTVTLIATPEATYHFSSWTGDVSSATNDTTTVVMSVAKSVTATFVPDTYTLTTTADHGSVLRVPGLTIKSGTFTTTHNYGDAVVLQAIPATGYTFTGWTGDATASTATTSVTMTADLSVTANFTPTPTYVLRNASRTVFCP